MTTGATTTAPPGLRLLRFDAVQRGAHWTSAALFATLVATAIPLYFGSLFGIVLPRHTVQMVHLYAGLALAVPVLVAALGPWGARLRRDVRRVNYWSRDERRWLATWGRAPLRAGKFNPGQKLNAVGLAAISIVLLVSGCMLQWFRFFAVTTRTGATFVHDLFAFVVVVVIVGHVALALAHPTAMRSMLRGWVPESWAAVHAPAWLDEERNADPGARRAQRGA